MAKTTKRRARGEGGFFQRADGKWVGRVTLADGTRKQIVRRDYAEAVEARDKLASDVRTGRAGKAKTTNTVADWLQHWRENIHRANVDPSTLDDYETTTRVHIVPAIGKIKLARLTADDVRTMHKKIAESSTRQAQIAHHILNRALKDACTEGKLDINVASMVPTPGHVKTKRTPWTVATAQRIMDTAAAMDAESGTRLASRVSAAFYTGARPGECVGLELDRVDLNKGIADFGWQLKQLTRSHGCGTQKPDGTWPCGRKVAGYCPESFWDLPPGYEHRECYKSLLWTRPKTDDGQRVLPIVEPLLDLMDRHISSDSGPNPYGLVWHHRDGRPISPREDHRYWAQLLAKAGVVGDRYTARHTTGTEFLHAGVDRMVAREVMGHADEQTTEIYQHVDLTLRREAMKKVAARFSAAH